MTIKLNTFTSFTTSNCYVLQPFDNEVCIFIDLPPDLDDALKYVKENNIRLILLPRTKNISTSIIKDRVSSSKKLG